PLPPFELSSFSRDQPGHFKPPQDCEFIVETATADETQSWQLYHFRKGDLQQTRTLAVGAVVTLRAAVESLKEDIRDLKQDRKTADFAYFDCYACHHDLKSPSWRQERGYVGVPGRPQIRAAAVPLLTIVLRHA